jgi:chitin synthase
MEAPSDNLAPCRTDSNRYSIASNSDNYHPGSGGFDSSTVDSALYNAGQRPRHDSNTLLMLPAPLGRPPTSSTGVSRSSEDNYMSDMGSNSHQRLIPSPGSPDQYHDAYEAPAPRYPAGNGSFESQISRTAGGTGAVLRNPTMSSQYPGETPNPFRNSEPYSAGYEDQHALSSEPEEYATSPTASSPTTTSYTHRHQQSRGVSLSDHGPVPGPEGVRRVSRPASKSTRPTSQTLPNQNRYSRGSTYNLPPGAAPPQGGHSGGYS